MEVGDDVLLTHQIKRKGNFLAHSSWRIITAYRAY